MCGWWRSGGGSAYTGEREQDEVKGSGSAQGRDEKAVERSVTARHTERDDSRDQSSAYGWTRGIGAMKRATDGMQDTGETHRRKRGGAEVSFTPPPS